MSRDKNGYRLEDLVIDACGVFDEESEHYDEPDEAVYEIADGCVPIYYYDIAKYAAHNHWLMTEIPELCSEGNAHDQIQSNIYEHIAEGLYEHIQEKQDKANERNRKIIKGDSDE